MNESEFLEIEETLKEWTCDDFKSFYEDVFPDGFDPFANSQDAIVPETTFDPSAFSFVDKYDNIEPEEALFELLQEHERTEKASCNDPCSKLAQESEKIAVTSGDDAKSKNICNMEEKQDAPDYGKTDMAKNTSGLTSSSNEGKGNNTKKHKISMTNRSSQTRWKIKKKKEH